MPSAVLGLPLRMDVRDDPFDVDDADGTCRVEPICGRYRDGVGAPGRWGSFLPRTDGGRTLSLVRTAYGEGDWRRCRRRSPRGSSSEPLSCAVPSLSILPPIVFRIPGSVGPSKDPFDATCEMSDTGVSSFFGIPAVTAIW